jgi:O-antigen/teichoic acid export membrane protein
VQNLAQRYLGSVLAKNTIWMIMGQGLRLVVQAAYFTVIARSLGASNYGAFVGVVALVGIVFPFGTLGSGQLLIKNVSRDKSLFATYWGRALFTTAVSTSILFALVAILSRFLLPDAIPLRLVFLVSGADLFGMSFITMCAQAFQAFERLNWTATINVLISTSRLVGALILISMDRHPSALEWGYLYASTTAVVVVLCLALVCFKIGWPHFNWRRPAAELREGFYFSVSFSAQTIYNDIDKTMLTRLGSLEAAGIYGAAYRLIDVSFAPVWCLMAAAFPNFFRMGAEGITTTLIYAKRLLLRALTYASLAAVCILLFAGIVPYILGPEYARTVEALRWLSLLPFLKALHYFLSDALTGAGYQAVRTSIQAGVAVFNVAINFWLIPAYSWRGAAWASIASDSLLVCGIGTAAFILFRRSQKVVLIGAAADAVFD